MDEDYEDEVDEELDEVEEYSIDTTTGHKKKKNPQKVEIIIEGGHHYSDSAVPHELPDGTEIDIAGTEFTSVGFMAKTYGGSGGCTSEEEIQNSVKHYKEWIIKEGDIPIVKDMRIKQTLDTWFGGEQMTKPKFTIEEVSIYGDEDECEGFQDGECLTEADGFTEVEQAEYVDRVVRKKREDKAQVKLAGW